MDGPIYAIGDVHGQLGMLEDTLALVDADGGAQSKTVFLGDYIDRGPDSRGVIDTLIKGKMDGRDWITLKGNHDRLFEWFMEEVPRHDPYLLVGYHWLHERIGGATTLASYGIDVDDDARLKHVHARARAQIPLAHVEFLNGLPITYQTDDLLFVHAGIRPGIPLDCQTEEDMIWIRQDFHDHTGTYEKLIVHGHTPVERATHYGNRVNLDTGAGHGKTLTAAVFEDGACWRLTDRGRERIRA